MVRFQGMSDCVFDNLLYWAVCCFCVIVIGGEGQSSSRSVWNRPLDRGML